jgi:hypothetical protein
MKSAIRLAGVLSLILATLAVAQTASPSADDEVLLRLTAESMPGSAGDVPVTLRRVDKPGTPIDLVATPGAVDAALIPPGIYELVSQIPVEIDGQQFRWQMQIPIFEHITKVRLSLANAVAVGSAAAQTTASSQPNTPVENSARDATPVEPSVEVEVRVDPSIGGVGVGTETPVELRRLDRPQAPVTSKISNGVARLRVAPGRYEIVTPQPVPIGAREYYWDVEAPLTDPVNHVQLSDWQALVLNSGASNLRRPSQHQEQVSGRNRAPMK